MGELELKPNTGVLAVFAPPNPSDARWTSNFQVDEGDALPSGMSTPMTPRSSVSGIQPASNGGGRRMHQMHDYEFSQNYLGDKHFLPLGAALAVDPMLRSVDLTCTGLRDSGMAALCDELRRSSTLQAIDVSENRFSI